MNVKTGDRAEIIYTEGGKMVGTIVRVGPMASQPPHSKYGVCWLCYGEAEALETELGDVSNMCHVPDIWLRKLPDDQQFKEKTTSKEKEKDIT